MPHMVATTVAHQEWRRREVDANPPSVCTVVARSVLAHLLTNVDYEICRWANLDVYCRRNPNNPGRRQVFAYTVAYSTYVVPAFAAEAVNISLTLDPSGSLHGSPA